MARVSTRWLGWLFLLAATVMAVLGGCAKKTPTGPSNAPPVISRVTATPDSVNPGGTAILSCVASDPDVGDTLSYTWTSLVGTLTFQSNQSTATWVAPGAIGRDTIVVSVTDGINTTVDSLVVPVYVSLAASITEPADGAVFTPGDTISFAGQVTGYTNLVVSSFTLVWESDVDGVLNTDLPDSLGNVAFSTALSYDVHHISLTATINDSLVATDTILVNNNQPEPVTLFDIERGYTANRLDWTRFGDPTRFSAYIVVRRTGTGTTGVEETIARIITDTDTVFVDSSVAIGETYTYRVLAENSFGISAASNAKSITAGVFTRVALSQVGEVLFGGDSFYAYASLTGKDEVMALDVTANNVDYEVTVGDGPYGLAYNSTNNTLYAANSLDTTITVIDLATMTVADTINLPASPFYIDYYESASRLYATMLGNTYPLVVQEGGAAPVITEIQDSRLILDSSLVRVDDARNNMYLSEIGGYPASLYRYSIMINPPVLSQEDTHGSLGYDLRDLVVTPSGNPLLVACQSPYYVQIIGSGNFGAVGSLPTGPYPNAVMVSPDGTLAFTARSGTDVQIWDLAAGTLLRTIHFADPVNRSGIRISPDGHYLVVTLYDTANQRSTLAIIYLP